MSDKNRTKEELIAELKSLRQKVSEKEAFNPSLKDGPVSPEHERKGRIYQSFIDNSNDAMYIVDLDGNFTYVNKTAIRLMGYPEKELIGKNISAFLYPDGNEAARQHIALISKGEYVPPHRMLVKTAFGDRVGEITISLLEEGGRPIGILGVARDITLNEQTIEAMREREEDFRTLFESATDGIFILDPKGNFIDANKTAYSRLGYTKGELLSMHISELDPPEFAPLVPERIKAVKERGFAIFESAHKRKDGTVMPVEVNARVLDFKGKKVMMSIIRDITERKKAETELKKHRERLEELVEKRTTELNKMEDEMLKTQKLESLGVLAGGIAHDFNNYVTAILNNIFLAKMHLNIEDRAFQMLAEAEKASFRAQALTQQLLTFSVGGLPVKKTVSIRIIVEEAAEFALRGSNVKCFYNFPANLWPVDIDEGLIGQAVGNLIINAYQAMPGGGAIEIGGANVGIGPESGLPLEPGRYIKLYFKDGGIGIPEEYLGRIFDPFFTTKRKGSGLGLATAYSVIKKHGGHITVESVPGKGTTFYVLLPASAHKPSQKVKVKPASFSGSGRVLVMDDEEGVRESLSAVLAISGYNVSLSEEGSEAVRLYKEAMMEGKPYDLVILDLTVPGGMGGLEVIEKLKKIDPDVKAVVSSGYSTDPVISDYRKYGFINVMAKPYKMEEIYRLLEELGMGK